MRINAGGKDFAFKTCVKENLIICLQAGLEWELCVHCTKPGNIWLDCSCGSCATALSVYLHQGLGEFCEPSPDVLLGCLVPKEEMGRKEDSPGYNLEFLSLQICC